MPVLNTETEVVAILRKQGLGIWAPEGESKIPASDLGDGTKRLTLCTCPVMCAHRAPTTMKLPAA